MTKKGVSWALAMIIILLIALSGGFMVRFAIGNLLEQEIQKTLGLRLLLHSFSLMRNSFNSMPQGFSTVTFTPPSTECGMQCLDCYAARTLLGTTAICDCTNYKLILYSSSVPLYFNGVDNGSPTSNYCCNGIKYDIDSAPNDCKDNGYVGTTQVMDENNNPVQKCLTTDSGLIPPSGCICESINYCCNGVKYNSENVPDYCRTDTFVSESYNFDLGDEQCNNKEAGRIPENGCYCGDVNQPIAEDNPLLDVGANTYGLVCDDFQVMNIKPIVLASNVEPASAGLLALLRAYPGRPSFWDDKYGKGVVNVYTESVLDLNDYMGVRSLLISAGYPEIITSKDLFFTIYRRNEWNYDTITKSFNTYSGLKGLVELVNYHCTNKTIDKVTGLPDNACLVSEQGTSYRYVQCPGSFSYNLIIPTGIKLNGSGTKVCEYECVSQGSISNTCEDGKWRLSSCFDFNDLKKNCFDCGCDNFNYNIQLCTNNECVGNSSTILNEFTYTDIYTGNSLGSGEFQAECTKSMPYNYCKFKDKEGSYSNNEILWESSGDCTINATCLIDGRIKISVGDTKDNECENEINCECDSAFSKIFDMNSLESQTIIINDHPKRSGLQIRLTDDLIEKEYEVQVIGDDSKPANDYTRCQGTILKLLSYTEYPRSLRMSATDAQINDAIFLIQLSNSSPINDMMTMNINLMKGETQ